MGSTLPLLVIEASSFSRTTRAVVTCGAGLRPKTPSHKTTSTTMAPNPISNRMVRGEIIGCASFLHCVLEAVEF